MHAHYPPFDQPQAVGQLNTPNGAASGGNPPTLLVLCRTRPVVNGKGKL
jgi:hypothetical protein